MSHTARAQDIVPSIICEDRRRQRGLAGLTHLRSGRFENIGFIASKTSSDARRWVGWGVGVGRGWQRGQRGRCSGKENGRFRSIWYLFLVFFFCFLRLVAG